MNKAEQIRQRVLRLQQQVNDLTGDGGPIQPASIDSPFAGFQPIVPTVPPSAVNQIRNGEWGHSVDTWFNPPAGSPLLNVGKEAAHWFSNDVPVAAQVLSFVDARTNPVNQTLKAYGNFGGVHANYNAAYGDWDRDKGQARFQGDKSLDAPFPNNRLVANNRAVEYVGALIAKRNSTIVIQSDNRIYAGVWNNDAVVADWLRGTAFVIAASSGVRGTPATTTERRYKILAFTDKGFQYLSAEFTIAAAPSDAAFATSDVYLTWKAIPGILQYAVYRRDITAGLYRLLRESLVSNTYVDNGNVAKNVAGYPTATDTVPRAFTATSDGDLDNIAVDGQAWTPLFLNIPIPSDYDMGAQTGEQVLRLGMDRALDRAPTDAVSTATSTTIQSTTGEFSAVDTGRIATLFSSLGAVLHGPEAITFVDTTHVTFATAVATSNTGATLYIEEGGDHGILIDALHVSYNPGAAFAAYPDDLNRLQNGGQNPIAAPSSSSQGGSGGGGGDVPGGGGVGCIALDCPVTLWNGERQSWRSVRVGEFLLSGNLYPNQILRKLKTQTRNLYLVRVRASWLYDIEIPCSPEHPIITERLETNGKAAQTLAEGDRVLCTIGSQVKRLPVRKIIDTGKPADVGTFALSSGHFYSAGQVYYRTWVHRLIARAIRVNRAVGVMGHNVKPLE